MKKRNWFWGLFFIMAAVCLLLSRMGFFYSVGIFRLFLTVAIAAWLFGSLRRADVVGILFSAAFLGITYAKELHITAITPWPILGAALLGSIGLSFMFPKLKNPYYDQGKRHWDGENKEHFDTIDNVEDSHIEFDTSFASAIKYVNADNLQTINLNCSFGAMKVFFDNAMIQNGNAVVNLNVSFAGVELYIPKTWKIVNNTYVSLGGIEEKNHDQSTGLPTLTMTGRVSFAGITIIYV
ncbi:LiaF transmembrane domain-containing protein [Hespellia stercorisuis]|uniref:LiaF transmembrane domain-containing protein n=1 Tax=Hespellia stercorisuis DSM 15480 TaxID=1121950 RepID=A0A1M6JLT9_9FIRM|nr:hypothetical protein [Hespellia stercorisuis]SHJ47610.1 hypothetical protein SAMN02745243_00691 [Hespellia stercorisuis DSM 15480]